MSNKVSSSLTNQIFVDWWARASHLHLMHTTKKSVFCHENLRRKNFRWKFATTFPTNVKIRWKLATNFFSSQNSLEICDEKFFVGKFVGNFQRIFRRKIFPTNFATNSKKPGIVWHFLNSLENSLEISNEFEFSKQFFSLYNFRWKICWKFPTNFPTNLSFPGNFFVCTIFVQRILRRIQKNPVLVGIFLNSLKNSS